ncbi:MAG: CRTAC1 family protein [Acidobacteria bacterium]|nr:MAG: CRTAC1 family protein [Acidobacteriota bacterium]
MKRWIIVMCLAGLVCAASVGLKASGRKRQADGITRFIDATANITPPYANHASLFDVFTSGGVCLFDYNNDGRVDIFVTNIARPTLLPIILLNPLNPRGAGVPNSLYQNMGDTDGDGLPNFVDVAAEVGVADMFANSNGCVAADFDNDGDMDLYVANGFKAVPFSMLGIHVPDIGLNIGGFLDPEGNQFPPFFKWDTSEGQLNGEFVVEMDPATGRPRGQGRNTLYRNMLMETGEARFVDITDEAGDVGGTHELPGGRHSTSVVAADVDRDGYVDLFVCNFLDPDFFAFFRQLDKDGNLATDGSNLLYNGEKWKLYHNNGDMTFTDITEAAGLMPREDPFIFNFNGQRQSAYDPNLKDAAGHPVGENWPHAWAASFSDYDRDGDLDLWIAPDIPGHLFLFRNDTTSDGTVRFTDVSRLAGVAILGDWMGFAIGDFDEDLDSDAFAFNFGGSNYLKPELNDPQKQFVSGAAEYYRWQMHGGHLNAVFRNDGLRPAMLDGEPTMVPIFPNIIKAVRITHSTILPPATSIPSNVAPPKSPLFGLEPFEFGWGSVAFDYDNDSHLDVYWIGSIGRGGDGFMGSLLHNPGRLLKGDGRWGFTDVTVEAHALDISQVNYDRVDAGEPPAPEDRINLQMHEDGKGVATADFNNDGFPDLFLTNIGGFDSNLPDAVVIGPAPPPLSPLKAFTPGPAFLFINQGNGNHWLKVRLVGGMRRGDAPGSGKSNRNGIGAVLIARFRLNGVPTARMREVRAGTGYESMSSLIQHFGLGDATVVDELEIRWPSGVVQRLRNIPADQTITVEEAR